MNLMVGRGINYRKFEFQENTLQKLKSRSCTIRGGFLFSTIEQKEIEMTIEIISLEQIKINNEINSRKHPNEEYIEELVEAIQGGAKIPPLVVFRKYKNNYLVDGFHRYEAYRKVRKDKIKVEIHDGGKRKATLFACGANAKHGLRRTNADKRLVVTKLLKDKKWRKWSDGKIAHRCAVSQAFVSKVKRELTQNDFEFPTSRITKNGKTMDTENIGKRKSTDGIGNTTKSTESFNLDTTDLTNDDSGVESDDNSENKKEKSNKRTNTTSNSTHKLSKKEIAQTTQQISNLTKRLAKLNTMFQESKRWTNQRTKKLRKIKNELDTAYTYLTEAIENIVENSN
jgi:hypothetical protein